MRRWLGLLAVLAAGCSSPTGGDHEYRLTIRPVDEPVETGAAVTGTVNGIIVEGGFAIGCADGTTRGELQRPAARELVLIVHAQWPEPCLDGVSYFTYEADIFVNAGRWHVQVLHTSSSMAAPPNTVFHDSVTVF